jgi:acyl-homoserine-lactone acylase
MRRSVIALATLGVALAPIHAGGQPADAARIKAHAAAVTIIRDVYGVPHVYGKSDADAVFGLVYAQAEDDFNRVELNYINAMGRLAEVEGEKELWRDLRMKLFIDPADLKAKYAASPAWLKQLMVAWADGLNHYLATHPEVKPKLLTRFEPWMALSFTEGSIGGDIAGVPLRGIEQFYGAQGGTSTSSGTPGGADAASEVDPLREEPRGSNGIALAPNVSASGHAMLLINPHTSFYFRPEVNVVSEEGLNVYGAVTWGQFFVYQGFNDRIGWMHTTGGGDGVDEYLDTIVEQNGRPFYRFGKELRPMRARTIALPYRTANGTMATRTVTAYYDHRGPVVRSADGKWITTRMMQDPVNALTQSYARTKARSLAAFTQSLRLRTNTSNNTVYADGDGNIALFYGNFVPARDTAYDYTKPVDGTTPATDWKGLHRIEDLIQVRNPSNGWVFNTNDAPWQSAGPNSPKQSAFPAYMWTQPENARGVHAVRVLTGAKDMTLDKLIAAANDSYLPAFATMLPPLLAAYDALPASDTLHARLAEPVAALRGWDFRYGVASVPTSLAIFWAEDLMRASRAAGRPSGYETVATTAPAAERLASLARATAKLERDFGTWKTPWGEINRFQRLTGDVDLKYDDAKPSLPVPFTSSAWGSLASFGPAQGTNTKRLYGNSGNSFMAVVEFGPRIRAKSLLAGGESGDPRSPHFLDQAERYTKSQYKDVYFYRADVEAHAERTYHPGELKR